MALRREGRVNPDIQVIKHGFLGFKKKALMHLPLLNNGHNGTFTILLFILDQDFCSFIPLFELVHQYHFSFPLHFKGSFHATYTDTLHFCSTLYYMIYTDLTEADRSAPFLFCIGGLQKTCDLLIVLQ